MKNSNNPMKIEIFFSSWLPNKNASEQDFNAESPTSRAE